MNELEWTIFKQLGAFPIDHLAELLEQVSAKESKITTKYENCDIRESLNEKQKRLYDELIKRLNSKTDGHFNASKLFYAFRDLLLTVLKYTGGEYKTLS